MHPYFKKYGLYFLIILFLFPALLINLGMLPFIDDEALRAIVALEMKLKGEYITPTVRGVLYYNKPPVFNWIILLFFNLTNGYSELSTRLPVVISLLLYGFIIWHFTKKEFGNKFGFLAALMFITCGRVLFYDSFRGLIDITYSMVTFCSFMAIFKNFEKQKYLQLFVFSYLLAAIAFLLKGLTAISFQGITLLVWFIANKKFKKLISLQHILGIFTFLIITGTYYFIYYQHNPNHLGDALQTIFFESTNKSAIGNQLLELLKHMAIFPIDMFYNFLPWSLFLLFLFTQKIRDNKLVYFSVLTLFFNFILFWLSPISYPRYLFPIIPFMCIAGLYLYQKEKTANSILFKSINIILLSITSVISLSVWLLLFEKTTKQLAGIEIITIGSFLTLGIITFFMFRNKDKRIELLILFLLILRIVFNLTIMPHRQITGKHASYKKGAIEAAQKVKGNNLFEKYRINYRSHWYITSTLEKIVPYNKEAYDTTSYFIVIEDRLPENLKYDVIANFRIDYKNMKMSIVKFNESKH